MSDDHDLVAIENPEDPRYRTWVEQLQPYVSWLLSGLGGIMTLLYRYRRGGGGFDAGQLTTLRWVREQVSDWIDGEERNQR